MAWVKMKNRYGNIVEIPEPVYNNMFKGNDAFSLVEDQPKPSPEILVEKEIVEDEQIQKSGLNERKSNGKSSKKTI